MSDIGPVKRIVRSIPLPAGAPEPVSVPMPAALPVGEPPHPGAEPG